MRHSVFLRFVHFGIRLSTELKDGIPACTGQLKRVKNGHV